MSPGFDLSHILENYSVATCDGFLLLMAEKPANQLRLVVFPISCRVSYIPGGAGFQPSTVSSQDRRTYSSLILWLNPNFSPQKNRGMQGTCNIQKNLLMTPKGPFSDRRVQHPKKRQLMDIDTTDTTSVFVPLF